MLCSSVHVEQTQMMEIPEAAVLMDQFAGRGLDFIVDIGQRVRGLCCTPSCFRQLALGPASRSSSRAPMPLAVHLCRMHNGGFGPDLVLLLAGGRGFHCHRHDRLRAQAG